MRIDPSIIQAMVAYGAIMAGFYLVVTRPMMKRIDDLRSDFALFKTEINERLNRMELHLGRIEAELKSHGERLARVEERLPPPLVHR